MHHVAFQKSAKDILGLYQYKFFIGAYLRRLLIHILYHLLLVKDQAWFFIFNDPSLFVQPEMKLGPANLNCGRNFHEVLKSHCTWAFQPIEIEDETNPDWFFDVNFLYYNIEILPYLGILKGENLMQVDLRHLMFLVNWAHYDRAVAFLSGLNKQGMYDPWSIEP